MNSNVLFAKTPPLKLFFLASIPGAISMLVFFCSTKLYACDRKSASGFGHFDFNSPDLSCIAGHPLMAAGTDGNLAEFCRDSAAGSRSVSGYPDAGTKRIDETGWR